ncbi:BTAD domain-containing putative transcriptional regulator [Wukongibacter baidiensis]|uniref:AfsR/SARP family transcriptional regulator n=1 Tax=Wukongibacter baidiensis TaxID=1723361 RepID=UPI003D7F3476
MSKLEIYTLGNLKVFLDDELINEKLSHKGIALLTYISLNRGKTFSRDKLAYLFWNSSNSEAARYNLRYTLWSLRKALDDNENEEKFITSYKQNCQINPKSDIYVDAVKVDDLIGDNNGGNTQVDTQNLEEVKKLYRGDFLEGFYVKDSIEFNDWVFYERERFQRSYFQSLSRLASIYKLEEKHYKCIETLEEMLKINPLHEEIYGELIKIHLKLGHRKLALNQYERCCRVLREELNTSPSDKTKEIYKEIANISNLSNSMINTENDSVHLNRISNRIKIYNGETNHKLNEEISPIDSMYIEADCYPIEGVEYYWISNMIEKIIEAYDRSVLQKIPRYYWKDIFRIQSSVLEITGEIEVKDALTSVAEKNRIFSATAYLLNELAKEDKITMRINNFQWIDGSSFEFIKYFLFKYEKSKVRFTLISNKSSDRIEELKRL